MLAQELRTHKYHYALLIILEALLLSLFVTTKDQLLQLILAVSVGLFYFTWGIVTHAGRLHTLRLMLEYAVVGLLASTMLVILVGSV